MAVPGRGTIDRRLLAAEDSSSWHKAFKFKSVLKTPGAVLKVATTAAQAPAAANLDNIPSYKNTTRITADAAPASKPKRLSIKSRSPFRMMRAPKRERRNELRVRQCMKRQRTTLSSAAPDRIVT